MQPIDVGDLQLNDQHETRQTALFHAIREKIVQNLWSRGYKLPSTRKLAIELSVSRNTVIYAYEQLVTEGYIESKKGSGFYVSVEQPEYFLSLSQSNGIQSSHDVSAEVDMPSSARVTPNDINRSFAPGVPDLNAFPFTKWQRLLQRHSERQSIAGNQDVQGSLALREALSGYLASSRSVRCHADRIIITAGAQQAISIGLMATLEVGDKILMEEPGYRQVHKIVDLFKLELDGVSVREKVGLDIEKILASDAKALYVTPSNQYPMGTTLNTDQRLKLIDWANKHESWIIEDDYDSEFQFAHRPYTSMQGLAGKLGFDDRIIYVGSMSKVMFNGLRLGYLVVPEQLVTKCLEIKDALSGDTASHTQAALADFVREGDLLRHIRKMRRLYKLKYEAMIEAIDSEFNGDLEVVSQAAGLHVMVKWLNGISEQEWSRKAEQENIVIRPFDFYEYGSSAGRDWSAVVLGFGNISLDDVKPKIKEIARLFYQ
ncbi:PLP-dependent aminotransferase family protein [Vibrio cyclitrophicus]|uniref:MocR-like pyridoxine biosynthesis transcription factor PdxR n=1 Tax=Vibrio cyclitrophicus TaxID=47951 RepID=UPI0002D6DAD3|nr:PLP-dependent aminotransferase family protein [Vibrio cyclitrophicus]KNH11304.1 GntR family transcriptional regulator [Vibrio lentus]ERM57300.1 putative transcriptional regulator of pyridoxine metabolism [Vibrio cyclitrophicus FF75]KAA8599175.1 Transcriptional regulator of pyridoxine metabolism [Vibrio cyclitrophicus]MBU2932291.1 PLP-dependent aminotransferase family protein [Vibrio cyclitrophicus]MCC4773784.1 PLP-dependent aminotransferase family protein [Vibrio cyclitrophicus]|tara:strand:- start:5951 stop:7411 length:1461 start_codon:yes stop_codon:yes gene_type:complete